MHPKSIDLLSQFEKENTRIEHWVRYELQINNFVCLFNFFGPDNLNSEVLLAHVYEVFDALPANMTNFKKFCEIRTSINDYINEHY
jgi:hypothetical protein